MTTRAICVAVLAVAACAIDGEPLDTIDLDQMSFHICGPDMGVHPDDSVLVDADNPFAGVHIGDAARWELQQVGPVPAFYAWATVNARVPGGESQYYAALNLKQIYERSLADPALLEPARVLAIRGFQAVLDHFPDSVTWDATGTTAYHLPTLSYKAIVDLGGTVEGWILVQTADGQERAIPL